MIVQLTPSWQLTDEHPASSYGMPVLVHCGTNEAYGAGDIVRCYPNWPFQPASLAVRRLGKLGYRSDEDVAFIERFMIGGAL